MASIAFTITNTDNTQRTLTAAVSNEQLVDIVTWAVETMSMPNDASGNPVSERTAEWAVNRWIETVVLDAVVAATNHKREKAIAAAAAAVVAPSVTIT